ncbi:MAG: hypothetical protein WD873_06020, partial [Candidatus Hydrogenedentales bacterium]
MRYTTLTLVCLLVFGMLAGCTEPPEGAPDRNIDIAPVATDQEVYPTEAPPVEVEPVMEEPVADAEAEQAEAETGAEGVESEEMEVADATDAGMTPSDIAGNIEAARSAPQRAVAKLQPTAG